MKKLTCLLLSLMFCCVFAQAQKIPTSKVPAQAGKAFRDKFPQAQQDSWSMEGKDAYEVEFFNGKKKQSAVFDATGKWLETETEIQFGQLPHAVASGFDKEFGGFKVNEVNEVETPDKGIVYEIDVAKGRETYTATFSAKGELLKKEKPTDED